jgi:hypothetical protein
MGDCQIRTNQKEKMQAWQVARINKLFGTKTYRWPLLRTGV